MNPSNLLTEWNQCELDLADCFKGFPLSNEQVKEINKTKLKICLVSPSYGSQERKMKFLFLKIR